MSAEFRFVKLGFADYPVYREAGKGETLYRVFGGATSEMIGCFYSFEKPARVTSAELNLNVVKWGNLCLYVATFNVNEGTPMYVGRIDQAFHTMHDGGTDIFIGGNRNARQVWIEYHTAEHCLDMVGPPERLLQDAVVSSQKSDIWH